MNSLAWRAPTADLDPRLRAAVRDVPDFPRPGILFRDLAHLLADPVLFRAAVDALAAPYLDAGITSVVAIESRGFLFGPSVAERLGVGLVPTRKLGKLPGETVREAYALEYGAATLEMHRDAFGAGGRVLIVDDVLATGGTAAAAGRLVERCGAAVGGFAFVVAITGLGGRAALGSAAVTTLLDL